MKLANYYRELPAGFEEDYRIDAKKKRVGILLNVIAGLIFVAVSGTCWVLKFGFNFFNFEEENSLSMLLSMGLFLVTMFAYIVVHELTHGLFYKIMTKQKLRFGMTLTVAYCGLKEGYVNKVTSLIALLSPLVIHSIWMIIAICFIPSMMWSWGLILVFGLHVGGCCGDMWGALILLFKYAKKPVLVGDDGPCQIFYTYNPANEGEENSDGNGVTAQTENSTGSNETEEKGEN